MSVDRLGQVISLRRARSSLSSGLTSRKNRTRDGGGRKGRRRKQGSKQTGLGGVEKIRVRQVDARTGPRGSGEQSHNMVVLCHVLNLYS